MRSIRYCAAASVLPVLALLGCADGTTIVTPRNDPPALLWSLGIDNTAVLMATGQTVKLNAVVRAADSTVLQPDDSVQWTSADTNVVLVDPDGTIHARQAGGPLQVIAKVVSRSQNVTVADTATITVTATPFAVARMRINPPATTVPVPSFQFLSPTYYNSGDVVLFIASVPAEVWATPSSRFTLFPSPGFIFAQAKDTGSVTLYAKTLAYGVVVRDSVKYTVTYPNAITIQISNAAGLGIQPYQTKPSFGQPEVTIVRGGRITWSNLAQGTTVDVTFDDPTNVTGGNITSLPYPTSQFRTFSVAGVYPYRDTRYGSRGVITVVP